MARNQWSKLPLTQVHVEELKASGITHEVAKARGYRSVKSSSEVEMLGFKRYQVPQSRMPGLVVPMYNPGSSDRPDSYQIKMATPRTARGREICCGPSIRLIFWMHSASEASASTSI